MPVTRFTMKVPRGRRSTRPTTPFPPSPWRSWPGAAREQLSDQAWADAQDLSYLDLKLIFLLVKRPRIIHDFFVLYSFEPHHPWKRLLALSLPGGMTALTVEVGFQPEAGPPGPEIDDRVIQQLTEEVQLFQPGRNHGPALGPGAPGLSGLQAGV